MTDYAPLLDPYSRSRYDRGIDAKVVVMGSTGVGKTSLLQRYTQNKFDPKNTTSTTGAFFVTKKVHVDGMKVRLQLWDTAGQERFRSMAPMYYRGANAALLLYDITNAESFDDVRGWLEELKKNCDQELIIYIVGAKVDLHRHRQVTADRVRLSIHNWFPPPRPPSPPPSPPQQSALSYIRPRFTSFTTSRTAPASQLAPKALDDNALSRPSDMRRAISALPHTRLDTSASAIRRANSANAAYSPQRSRPHDRFFQASRFGAHFGHNAGAYVDTVDGSSGSLPEEDEDDDDSDELEWGLEKGMSLFEVSAKDDHGVRDLFDSLISVIISRREQIERENELKKRDSVFLSPVITPAWSAQADEEEKRQAAAGNSSWSCCQL